MRALFFVPYSKEAAGCRYRVHQFVPYLEQHGVECELRELVKPDLYRILYRPGHGLEKAARFSSAALGRMRDLRDAREYDVLFVYRECFPFGPAWMEEHLARLGRPIVYDFDDAIYLPTGSKLKDMVRVPQKTLAITLLADEVIICNEHLLHLCLAYNRNVTIVPTSVDTEQQFYPRSYAEPLPPANGRPVRLGWIGSHSTAKYLSRLAPVLQRVAQRYPIELFVVGAGRDLAIPGITVVNKAWSLETELDDFRSIDIGLYPLHDDLWELGKTSFKTIQYMAVGVPGVVSRVGTAKQIVRDGENGFLATSDDEWVEKICRLIEQPELRQRIGAAGRRTAVDDFSVASNAPKLLEVLQRAHARGRRAVSA
jgi:glycosyltransferase involved in cell wall biosynthesis